MSAESDPSSSAEPEPTRALLLAQALDACIEAERRVRGSADQVIARQPAWARAELRRLVALAGSLDATATAAVMSDEFRVAARARLMRRIAPDSLAAHARVAGQNGHTSADGPWLMTVPSVASRNGHHVPRRRSNKWLWRGGLGGLLAAVLVGAATLTASANALPGEPLYSIKQVREELGVRFAADDEARTLAMLNRADARLDETARLLQQGRTEEVSETTLQYDNTITRATTTYVVTIAAAPPADQKTVAVENKLSHQQEQLETLLDTAPEPARSDIREALVATERGRALVADPKPTERRASGSGSIAAAPTMATEVEPTKVPVRSVPPPIDLVAQPTPLPIAEDQGRHEGRSASDAHPDGDQGSPPAVSSVVARSGGPVNGRNGSGSSSGRRQEQRVEVPLAPAVGLQEGVDADSGSAVRGRDDTTASLSGRGDGDDGDRSSADDRVVAPSRNQGDERERVAEATSAPVQAVVVQHSSSSDGSRSTAAAQTSSSSETSSASQTSTSSGGRTSFSHDGSDGGETPRAVATSVPQTARVQATAVSTQSSDDRHGDTDSGNTRFTSSSGTQSSGSGTQTSGSRSGSGDRNSGSGSHSGGGH